LEERDRRRGPAVELAGVVVDQAVEVEVAFQRPDDAGLALVGVVSFVDGDVCWQVDVGVEAGENVEFVLVGKIGEIVVVDGGGGGDNGGAGSEVRRGGFTTAREGGGVVEFDEDEWRPNGVHEGLMSGGGLDAGDDAFGASRWVVNGRRGHTGSTP